MSTEAGSFSVGVDRVLWSLHPGHAPEGVRTFPDSLIFRDLIMRGDQNLHEVFCQVVNSSLKGDVRRCQIEENLAVFAGIAWHKEGTIRRCHIIAIKTETCDLKSFYDRGERQREVRYFRLDADFRIGEMFTHSYPHVHAHPREAPRYSLNGWPSANVVVDFLEHVYLESFHDKWVDWAGRVWSKHWAFTRHPDDQDPFARIVQAFHDSQYGVLAGFRTEIESLKRVLRNKKDDLFPLRLDMERYDLLAYPTG